MLDRKFLCVIENKLFIIIDYVVTLWFFSSVFLEQMAFSNK